jgi:hypothetical protein
MIPRFTLTTDGTSDRVLVPILNWMIEQTIHVPIGVEWADPHTLPAGPGYHILEDRIPNPKSA